MLVIFGCFFSYLRICSHLMKKSLTENLIFCEVPFIVLEKKNLLMNSFFHAQFNYC